ncbi:MAG: DmsC/YnfH family molybdoenzyme membrane anchor subunit [Pseudomonadota bacterium]
MHPAKSVILFTVSSGLGFGMMILLGLGIGPVDAIWGPLTGLAALGLSGIGLLSSTFHLGNPQRFLKAFTQWRSSWLSREGVVSVILMALFFAYVVLWYMSGAPMRILGIFCAALALAAVICTSMIYGQIKAVPRWSTPYTVAMFIGYALTGGILAVSLAMTLSGTSAPILLAMVMIATSAAAYAYRRRAMAITLAGAGSSPETATGLGKQGTVRLLESPHSQPNYLMKEMVFRVGRKHAEKLALIAVILGLFAPLFLFIVSRDAAGFGALGIALALIMHFGGALVSRWLFFAEAEHVVGLYYGQR